MLNLNGTKQKRGFHSSAISRRELLHFKEQLNTWLHSALEQNPHISYFPPKWNHCHISSLQSQKPQKQELQLSTSCKHGDLGHGTQRLPEIQVSWWKPSSSSSTASSRRSTSTPKVSFSISLRIFQQYSLPLLSLPLERWFQGQGSFELPKGCLLAPSILIALLLNQALFSYSVLLQFYPYIDCNFFQSCSSRLSS